MSEWNEKERKEAEYKIARQWMKSTAKEAGEDEDGGEKSDCR
jgi:hypothetical protein